MFTDSQVRIGVILAAVTIAGLAACSDVAEPPVADMTGGAAGSHLVFDCAAQTSIPDIECEALVALYNGTEGDAWNFNTGWLTAADPCTWDGVGCADGAVNQLILAVNGLSGPIPPELGDLAGLESLGLVGNQLSGSIPPELGSLANLEILFLFDNELSGSIPPELGDLASLEELSLFGNELSGSIPPELGNLASLQELELSANQLSGSIPPELGSLGSLRELSLYGNELSGSIPPEIGNLTSLRDLWLSDNQLSGSIPPELGNLASLVSIRLFTNQLSGSIPPELGNLAGLQELWLLGNELSGPIPPELGNLASLHDLWLSANQLSGSIPPELGNLASLRLLLVVENNLTGQVPLPVAQVGGGISPADRCDLMDNPGLFMPDNADYRAADADGDGVICGILLGADSDGDAIPDATDPDLLAEFLEGIPDAAFKSGDGGHRTAMQSRLDDVERDIADGNVDDAIRALENLKRHVDGCGTTADMNDWITECTDQLAVRDWIETLITNLGG